MGVVRVDPAKDRPVIAKQGNRHRDLIAVQNLNRDDRAILSDHGREVVIQDGQCRPRLIQSIGAHLVVHDNKPACTRAFQQVVRDVGTRIGRDRRDRGDQVAAIQQVLGRGGEGEKGREQAGGHDLAHRGFQ